jgi:hypothetical protein
VQFNSAALLLAAAAAAAAAAGGGLRTMGGSRDRVQNCNILKEL